MSGREGWALSSRQWRPLEVAKEGQDMTGSVFLKDQSMGACREWIMGSVVPALWTCPRWSEVPEPSTVMILLLSSWG